MATRRKKLIDRILGLEAQMYRAVGYGEPAAWLGAELTMAQVKVLFLLFVSGPVSLSHLAHAMQVSVGTASAVVDRMVGHRLVSRTTDPDDRRFVRLDLTDDGRTLVHRLHEDSRLRTARLLEVMDTGELEVVLGSMKVMIAAADRLLDEPEETP